MEGEREIHKTTNIELFEGIQKRELGPGLHIRQEYSKVRRVQELLRPAGRQTLLGSAADPQGAEALRKQQRKRSQHKNLSQNYGTGVSEQGLLLRDRADRG